MVTEWVRGGREGQHTFSWVCKDERERDTRSGLNDMSFLSSVRNVDGMEWRNFRTFGLSTLSSYSKWTLHKIRIHLLPVPGYSVLLPRPCHRSRPTKCGSYRKQHGQILYLLVLLNPLVSSSVVCSLICIRHWAHQERWSHYDRITMHSPQCRVQRSDIHCMTCALRAISRSKANEEDAAQVSRDSW